VNVINKLIKINHGLIESYIPC